MQIQKTKNKSNKSVFFQYSAFRYNHIEELSDEYINILAILYGGLITGGDRRISEYGKMTMQQAERELRLRTAILQAQTNQKRTQLREEYSKNEQDLLAELAKASS